MGTRKINTGDIFKSTKSNSVMTSNVSDFNTIANYWEDFINEPELEGKGWKSAKGMAGVFKTINQTFRMLSEQVSERNQKVISSQSILKNEQIDEQALKQRIEQNQQTMGQLLQAQSIWRKDNPGKPSSSFDNLNRSIGNENAVLQQELDSLDDFDMATKYVYDDLDSTKSQLKNFLSQVSKTSNFYDSKTGLFTTKNIDMKNVAKLDKTLEIYYESEVQKAIKAFNDLYQKNPAKAIQAIKENEKLFGYLIAGLDKLPTAAQEVVLSVFILK